MKQITITEEINEVAVDILESNNFKVVKGWELSKEELLESLISSQGIIVRVLDLDKSILSKCNELKIISKHGVGIDNIDIDFAKDNNIRVTTTPGANSLSVAEHTFALLLSLSKNIKYISNKYKEIGFKAKNLTNSQELFGKTIGIIGFGHIGRIVGHMAYEGFNMNVLTYDPYLKEKPDYVNSVSNLKDLLENSDFISLHVGLNEETRHMISKEEIKLMKPETIIINCGRGGLINEDDLIEAIENNKIAGAGLDVTEEEPLNSDSRLFKYDNVIVTPHYAPNTFETSIRVAKMAAENIVDFFNS